MIEESGPRAGSGSGSLPLTNGSGSGSRRPENIWIRIRIRNTGLRNGGRAGLVHQHRLQYAVLQVAPPQHAREAGQPKAHDEEGGQPEVVGRDAGVLRPGKVFLVDVTAGGAALVNIFDVGIRIDKLKKG
jgi:hypothetical protein